MKLGLESKVKTLVDGYNTNADAQRQVIRGILEPFKVPSYAMRFTTEGLQATIKEQMDGVMKNWKQYNKTLNQTLKTDVAAAKKSLLKSLGLKSDKGADAGKIANARAFLKDELDMMDAGQVLNAEQAAALDDTMHMILKDFIADYDTMCLFLKMVEKKTTTVDGNGVTIFPKTFGRVFKVRNAVESIASIEADAEMLFIREMTDSDEYIRINGLVFSLPMDTYSEKAAEKAVLDNAAFLDDFADHIDSEGQDFVPGGSVTKL